MYVHLYLFIFLSFLLHTCPRCSSRHPISLLLFLLSTISYLSTIRILYTTLQSFSLRCTVTTYKQPLSCYLLVPTSRRLHASSLYNDLFLDASNSPSLIFSVSISIIFSFRFLSSLQLQTGYSPYNTIQVSLLTY